MKRMPWSVFGVVVAVVSALAPAAEPVAATAPAEAPTVKVESRVFSSTAETGQSLPYLVVKPVSWDAKKTYPLLVFLHGAGEAGDDNQAQLKWGREWMEKAVSEFDAVVVAPIPKRRAC